ncbi:MAG: nucleotide exchange factor GrpE [Oscillochloris sp.]|nr:nucleotide exchange factor GrpE [Oscillochloris sp.]
MSEEQTNTQPETNAQPVADVADAVVEEASGARLAELESRLAKAEAQAAEYKDQWLRATADYKNFKRRADTERAELIRSAGSSLLLKILPVVDDFDRAIANIPAEIAESAWWGGTQLIAQKLRTLLESEGVKPIMTVGQEFDPNIHEAVLYEDAEGQDGKVVAELQRGYRLYERVLRPAMVKVGRG